MKENIENIAKKSRKYVNILGINVSGSGKPELLTRVKSFLSDSIASGLSRHKFYIVTPNPELVLMAQDNPALKDALNSADIAIPDGVGLKLADPSLKVIKGREIFMDLINLSSKNNWKVFLLGGLGREALAASQRLHTIYNKLQIESDKGPKLDDDADPVTEVDRKIENDIFIRIDKFQPDLLFVAFGNPKQEIWIHKNLSKLKIGGAMAVGGTFRYIAGISKLPPLFLQKIGLEWLWRLAAEPKRIVRIIRAVVFFPSRLLFSKFFHA